jgi:hypothetical protein
MADFLPQRPKGMHNQTYEELTKEAEAADRKILAIVTAQIITPVTSSSLPAI